MGAAEDISPKPAILALEDASPAAEIRAQSRAAPPGWHGTRTSNLTPADLARLAASGISSQLATQAQLRRVDSREGCTIAGRNGSGDYEGLVFPYIWPGETGPREYRLRRDRPEIEYKDGKPKEKNKYLSAPGGGNRLYFVPGSTPEWLTNPTIPVVIVEGEKKCLSVWGLSDPPRFLPIGLPGVWNWRSKSGKTNGANGERRSVSAPISDLARITWKGRKVTILYDTNARDNESVQAARRELTTTLRRRGAKMFWFAWPEDTPAGVNGIDDLVGLWGPEKVLLTIEQRTYEPTNAKASPNPMGFTVTNEGVFHTEADNPEARPVKVCSKLEVVAATRSEDGEDWGRLLRWPDIEARPHRWAMPMALLAGDCAEYRRELLRGGLTISTSRAARDLLTIYIQSARPTACALCVNRIGWHGDAFVLPDTTIGPAGAEEVVFQYETSTSHYYNVSGTLDEWRENISWLCSGNTKLTFVVSAAFAGSLLAIVNAEGGGFHYKGLSSTGKTTMQLVGGSICGGGGRNGFVCSWRATANGLESVAELHNHSTLFLDELSQVDPRDAGEIAYLLANGRGKVRMTKNVTTRRTLEWNLLFVSSGEITLADHVASAGKKVKAGAEIRLVNLEADAGAEMGVFENLHEFESPDALSRHLKDAALRYYGTPLRAFIEFIAEHRAAIAEKHPGYLKGFLEDNVSAKSSGEVFRAAERFALVGAAGELATQAGITGWQEGEAIVAAEKEFKNWLAGRGTSGSADAEKATAQVRNFIELHGTSRFQPIKQRPGQPSVDPPLIEKTINQAGYYRTDDDGDVEEFLVWPEVFKAEVCRGFDYKMVANTLIERGLMEHKPPSLMKQAQPPGSRNPRWFYSISASILEVAGPMAGPYRRGTWR
jgi:uncharacterized protein (DUF927 family)